MPEKACWITMLRDESENVERMMRSIEGLWSNFVIGFDRATTDDTEAIVRHWLKGREHLGYFYYYDWPNSFAAARNMNLDLAYQRYPECAYILSFDGDDVLCPRSRPVVQSWLNHPDPSYRVLNAYIYLDFDEWGLPYLIYPRAHLWENSPDIRFEGAAHNVITCPSEQQLLIQQMIVWHKQAPRKRAMREQQRVSHNIPNLTTQAEDAPTDGRPLFYLGNSLLDAGQYPAAEATYHAYLARSTWPDERYQAYLHLAALRFLAGDLAGAKAHIWSAIREPHQWNRAEAYVHLADCALAEGLVGEAIHWFSIAGEMPPPVSSMFLQGAMYTYLPHWRLALLYDRLGMPEKAYAHAARAYQWRPSPDIEAALQALADTMEALMAPPAPETGAVPERRPVEAMHPELPLATQILPIPEAELARLLAEIPVGVTA